MAGDPLEEATKFVLSNAEGDGVRELPKYFEEALSRYLSGDPEAAKKLFASLWKQIKEAQPDTWTFKNLRNQQSAEILKACAEKHGAHFKKA